MKRIICLLLKTLAFATDSIQECTLPADGRTVRYVVPTCQAENEGHGKGAEERRKSRQRPFRYTRVGYRRPMVSP